MEERNVTFIHPTTGEAMEVAINPNLTASQVTDALIAEKFLSRNEFGSGVHFMYAVNGGAKAVGSQTMGEAGIRDGSVINIVAEGSAG